MVCSYPSLRFRRRSGREGVVTEAGVEFADVSYAFGSRDDEERLLHGVSLKLEPGTTTALLGRSGSGKTTLMRMVNGLVMPTGGAVRLAGRPTTEWNLLELRRGVGYVIQETGLFPHWTVERNVGLALELAGRRDKPRLTEVLRDGGPRCRVGGAFSVAVERRTTAARGIGAGAGERSGGFADG